MIAESDPAWGDTKPAENGKEGFAFGEKQWSPSVEVKSSQL
jgi:hypothetical protein